MPASSPTPPNSTPTPAPTTQTPPPTTLKREVGLGGAVLLGLGSMLGSGVFVALGLAAGLASPGYGAAGVLGAVGLAGLLALCNGLSSAQLAGVYPVSGGTYEYAHRVGWPAAGAAAGVLFLVAKSASAATAALGSGGVRAGNDRRPAAGDSRGGGDCHHGDGGHA